MVEVDSEVIPLDKGKGPFAIILPITLSTIAIIIGAIACRYFMNKSKRDLHVAQKRAQRAKEFDIT